MEKCSCRLSSCKITNVLVIKTQMVKKHLPRFMISHQPSQFRHHGRECAENRCLQSCLVVVWWACSADSYIISWCLDKILYGNENRYPNHAINCLCRLFSFTSRIHGASLISGRDGKKHAFCLRAKKLKTDPYGRRLYLLYLFQRHRSTILKGNLPIVLRNAFRLNFKGDFEAHWWIFNFEQT
jgi:hypothetical protein